MIVETGASNDPALERRLDDLMQQMYGLYHSEIDLSLDRVVRFLGRLGNPHLNLPKTVHVAGTNGKGSTIATLRSALETAGFTVHCATSPHLVHPTERIVLAGKPISTADLVAVLDECLRVNRDEPITFFEMFLAASFLMFARVPADYLLLETGMGGRLDATNVVTPVCTVITMISHDHEAFLGPTLRDIAREKAGIMKPGVPCVIGYQTSEAMESGVLEVFHQQSQALSPPARLVQAGAHWCAGGDSTLIRFSDESGATQVNRPNLPGDHQIHNAGAALAAFRLLEPGHFTPEILSTAFSRIKWPGRLDRIENTPLNALLPGQWELVLDGGHNDSAGLTLAKQAENWERTDPRPLHLVVAMVNRKDAASFLRPLVPHAASLTVTAIPDEKTSYAVHELEAIARPLGFADLRTAATAEDALGALGHDPQADVGADTPPGRVLLCGSLYFIGHVMRSALISQRL